MAEAIEPDYDFIIVGGGSAGCVAANRLVLDHGARVLLLEAGQGDDDPVIRMPAGTFKMLFGNSTNLTRYGSTPQAHLGGRSVRLAQGNVLGGGSSVNAHVYIRGEFADYAEWTRAAGGFPWDWDDLLPYFRRQEGNRRFDNEAHGGDGPYRIGDPLDTTPSSELFLRTMQRLGLPYRDDFAAGTLGGAGFIQTAIHDGRRCSAADAFLTPIRDDPRLTILTGARVRRVLFDGRQAIGVDYDHRGTRRQTHGRAGVILTAGALVTPKLLMLSGIGPANHLADHGIAPLVDLQGVGENLQDHHVAVFGATTEGAFGLFGEDRGLRLIRNLLRYKLFGDGPIAMNGSDVAAFVNLDDPKGLPDLELYCLPVLWPSETGGAPTHGITLMANLVKPRSRGRVRLQSADPDAPPAIDLNWLSDPEDGRRLLDGLKYLRRIAATHPFSAMIAEEQLPGRGVRSDAALMAYIRETTETNFHPVGTCKMGSDNDPMAVLTPDLRVRGVDGLHVLDASMMPRIISANTNATAMAVADRGVDLMMRR